MVAITAQRRLKKLEADSGGGKPPCDTCGWGGGEEPFGFGPDDTYELVFDDTAEDEWCPACDRQTSFVIKFAEDL